MTTSDSGEEQEGDSAVPSEGADDGRPSRRAILLEDPVALRALAHPARQRLVAELFAGNVLTATEAAELVGLTPSAVSHHLRALAKYGLAERAAATGDGRERPWRGTGTDLNLSLAGPSQNALQGVTHTAIATAVEELDAFMDGQVGAGWSGHIGLNRCDLWLTTEETKRFSDELQDLMMQFSAGRHTANHPPDARRSSLTLMFVPVGPPPEVRADGVDRADRADPAGPHVPTVDAIPG